MDVKRQIQDAVVSFPGLFTALVFLFTIHRFRTWYRLKHIRGPFLWTISDCALLYKTGRGRLPWDLAKLCREYGPVVRIAPNYVICGDPIEVRRIWGPRSSFDRTEWQKGLRLDPPDDYSVTTVDPVYHSRLRSQLSRGYSGKGVEGLHESIDKNMMKFCQTIQEKHLSSDQDFRPVDLVRLTQYLTMDVLGELAFGEPFGFLEQEDAHPIFSMIEVVEKAMPIVSVISMVPWMIKALQSPVFKPFRPSDKDSIGLGKMKSLAKAAVAQRYGPNSIKKRDMLGSFVENGLSQKEAEGESMIMIAAGSETTATALRTILLYIITAPTVYTHLLNEIKQGVADGTISSPITDLEARNLPFLQACIKEGLRICPLTTSILPKISTKDEVIAGVHIPAGTNVCWSVFTCFRDEDVFGPDADMFLPRRWIDASPEKIKVMENTFDLIFGSLKWPCLGRAIAAIELNKGIVELLRRFEITVVDPVRPVDMAWYSIIVQSGFYVRISERVEGL